MQWCWYPDPAGRPTAEEVVSWCEDPNVLGTAYPDPPPASPDAEPVDLAAATTAATTGDGMNVTAPALASEYPPGAGINVDVEWCVVPTADSARCSGLNRILHSRMLLDPTFARVKRASVGTKQHSSQKSTFLPVHVATSVQTLQAVGTVLQSPAEVISAIRAAISTGVPEWNAGRQLDCTVPPCSCSSGISIFSFP
jgi:hypothetical protein